MNESLINPFSITHPTTIQVSIYALASFARFDPSGRYAGVGRLDGTASVFDLQTRSDVRLLDGHVSRVTHLDWSSNSRYVVTCSKDCNVILWDLASEADPLQRLATIRFDVPVRSAWFHPRNSNIILVTTSAGEVFVVDRRAAYEGRYVLEAEDGTHQPVDFTCAKFNPSGKLIFAGTSTGVILVFNTRTQIVIGKHRISGAGSMVGFEFAKHGRRLVTNSSDRTLRQFNLPEYDSNYLTEHELEPTHRFHDPINRSAWHAMSYSPDGEWLAGGSADSAAHRIFVWDISNEGQLATTLDGGREPLLFLHWHPSKSSIISTDKGGNLLVWHTPTPERWGAFAGGFEEVDENIDYEEKEDEFDLEDEEETKRRKAKEEDQVVDVDTVVDNSKQFKYQAADQEDEDILWADQDSPDGEVFKMKTVMVEPEEDVYRR